MRASSAARASRRSLACHLWRKKTSPGRIMYVCPRTMPPMTWCCTTKWRLRSLPAGLGSAFLVGEPRPLAEPQARWHGARITVASATVSSNSWQLTQHLFARSPDSGRAIFSAEQRRFYIVRFELDTDGVFVRRE